MPVTGLPELSGCEEGRMKKNFERIVCVDPYFKIWCHGFVNKKEEAE